MLLGHAIGQPAPPLPTEWTSYLPTSDSAIDAPTKSPIAHTLCDNIALVCFQNFKKFTNFPKNVFFTDFGHDIRTGTGAS
jgi:hypothetical protein